VPASVTGSGSQKATVAVQLIDDVDCVDVVWRFTRARSELLVCVCVGWRVVVLHSRSPAAALGRSGPGTSSGGTHTRCQTNVSGAALISALLQLQHNARRSCRRLGLRCIGSRLSECCSGLSMVPRCHVCCTLPKGSHGCAVGWSKSHEFLFAMTNSWASMTRLLVQCRMHLQGSMRLTHTRAHVLNDRAMAR
jgi:hypothetical protein